jgi:hypothetical protein
MRTPYLAGGIALVAGALSVAGGQLTPQPSEMGRGPARLTVDTVHHEIVIEIAPIHVAGTGQGSRMRMAGTDAGMSGMAGMDEMGAMAEISPRTVAFGIDGWLQGYAVDILDSAGRPLPHHLIHHVNLIIPRQRDLFSQTMLRLGAVGSETPPVELPRVLGFRIRAGDSLTITAMLHNESPTPVTCARLVVRMRYVPASTWFRPLSIYPIYLDVMPPAGVKAYDLPAGHSEKSWDARPAVSGRLLAVGAHLHKYATEIRLEDVTAHRVIWRAAPVVDRSGEPVDMPVKKYWWRLGIPVSADHVYRLTAVYDNPTGHMIPEGAMGALGGVIYPDAADAWPAVDSTSASYRLDRDVTFRVDGDHADGALAQLPQGAPGSMLTHTVSAPPSD